MVRIRAVVERLRENLFVVPALFLVLSVVLAELTLTADRRIDGDADLPAFLTSTVDSSRAVLQTVAGATIGFAGVAISISLLMIQLAANRYSPRALYGFFRDPFTKRVVGLVIGTFTYCLVVLRVVRSSDDRGIELVPHLSTTLAVALGVASVLAVVALIDHTARTMQVGPTVRRIAGEARERIEELWPARHDPAGPDTRGTALRGGPVLAVAAPRDGWVQLVDDEALLRATPPGVHVEVVPAIGAFVVQHTPLLRLAPQDGAPSEEILAELRDAIAIGESRTMREDTTFGLRQLADIALRALSPGVNDPTTAEEAMWHAGSVLRELVSRREPDRVVSGEDGRRVLHPAEPDLADHVDLAFGQVRRAARGEPQVLGTLLAILGMLRTEAEAADATDHVPPLRRQAGWIVEGAADLLPADLERVHSIAKANGFAGAGR